MESEKIIISNLALNSAYEFYLYNSIGKCIRHYSIDSGKNNAEILTAHFLKGIYLLKISSTGESKTFKIQIE